MIDRTLVHPFLVKKAYRKLKAYAAQKEERTQRREKREEVIYMYQLQKYFGILYKYKEKYQKEKFLQQRNNMRLMKTCFGVLKAKQVRRQKGEICELTIQAMIKNKIFDAFKRYATYQRYMREKEVEATKMTNKKLQFKYLKRLMIWKTRSKIDRKCTKAIQRAKCFKILAQWRILLQEAIDTADVRHLADEFFLRNKLKQLQRNCKVGKSDRALKSSLLQRQNFMWELRAKRRGLRQLALNMEIMHQRRVQDKYTNTVRKKNLFQAWARTIDIFKRRRLIKEQADIFYEGNLMTKVLTQLSKYTQMRKHCKFSRFDIR